MEEPIQLSNEVLRNLQLTELEMIAEVDRICRKNRINYSLDGGTLLGAIRHKGFIPWDDDADVIFTRHEYAKFYKCCKTDLDTERFFLQEYRTDPGYRWGYAKLRRKGTDFVRFGQEHTRYKKGVCIDLFVVDNVPDSMLLRRLYYGYNYCLRKILYSDVGRKQAPNPFLRIWYRLLYLIPRDPVFRARNHFAIKCNRRKTELVSHLTHPYPSKATKYGMPSECFEEFIDMEFEGFRFKAFKQYDRYLSLLYGDYMKLPPADKRKIHPASKLELLDISIEDIRKRYS